MRDFIEILTDNPKNTKGEIHAYYINMYGIVHQG